MIILQNYLFVDQNENNPLICFSFLNSKCSADKINDNSND